MKKGIKIIAVLIIVIISIIPIYWWVNNPEATQIQLLINFWWLYLTGIVSSVILILIDSKL